MGLDQLKQQPIDSDSTIYPRYEYRFDSMLVAVQEFLVANVIQQHPKLFDGQIKFTPKMKEEIQSILDRAEKKWKWTLSFKNNGEATELKDAFVIAIEDGKIEDVEKSLDNLRTTASIQKNSKVKNYLPIVRGIYEIFQMDIEFIEKMEEYFDDFVNLRKMEELPKRLAYYIEMAEHSLGKWNIIRQDLFDRHYETLNALVSTTEPTSDQLTETFMMLRLFKYYARCLLAKLLQKYVSNDVNMLVIDLIGSIRMTRHGGITMDALLDKKRKIEKKLSVKGRFIAFNRLELEILLKSFGDESFIPNPGDWTKIESSAETVLKTSKVAEVFSPVRINWLELSRIDHLELRIIEYQNALTAEWQFCKQHMTGFGSARV